MKKKTGVLLVNLGTPDSPSVRDVRRYLREFLNDPRVIDIPAVLRLLLVNLIIIPFRAPRSAKIYKELWEQSGNRSPLLKYGESLRDLLAKELNTAVHSVYLAMRYGKPSMDAVLSLMEKEGFDQVIVFPLFPQYASASTGSAVEKALKLMAKWYVIPEIKVIGQY